MKKLLFLLLITLPFLGMAQNKGKVNENNTAKIEYVGWQNGLYSISLTNKEACTITFRVAWLGKDTLFTLQGFQTRLVQLPGGAKPYEIIKAKPTASNCNGIDNGWIEVETPASLPVKFSYFAVKRLDPETLAIVFTTYETENVKYFHITVSDDGKNWRRVVVVMPNTYNPNGTYTTQVKIKTLKK